MDPNVAYERLRRLATKALNSEDFELLDAVDMAESFDALDQWIRKGGFFPKQWAQETK